MSEEITREQAIGVITMHREHWRRLLQGNVCSKAEGEESIASFDMAIAALEAERQWTPVERELPKAKDGEYLVTRRDAIGRPTIVTKRSYAKNLYRVDEFDFHDKKGASGWYDYDSEYGYYIDTNVVAWMPLPKPYDSQESEVSDETNN